MNKTRGNRALQRNSKQLKKAKYKEFLLNRTDSKAKSLRFLMSMTMKMMIDLPFVYN